MVALQMFWQRCDTTMKLPVHKRCIVVRDYKLTQRHMAPLSTMLSAASLNNKNKQLCNVLSGRQKGGCHQQHVVLESVPMKIIKGTSSVWSSGINIEEKTLILIIQSILLSQCIYVCISVTIISSYACNLATINTVTNLSTKYKHYLTCTDNVCKLKHIQFSNWSESQVWSGQSLSHEGKCAARLPPQPVPQ